jgi:hypothetical protein
MKIGLDFWNVITQFPDQMKHLAASWFEGNEVYIISAVGDRAIKKYGSTIEEYKKHIESFGVANVGVEVLYFEKDDDIAQMKLEACKRLGIELFIDDRPGTVELLHRNGIVALLMPKPIKILHPETKVEKQKQN